MYRHYEIKTSQIISKTQQHKHNRKHTAFMTGENNISDRLIIMNDKTPASDNAVRKSTVVCVWGRGGFSINFGGG